MKIYVLGAGASKPDGMPITNELVEQAFWNFGGPQEGTDRRILGTWDDRKENERIFLPVFRLFDHLYKTRLEAVFLEYYKTAYHPAQLNITTEMVEGFLTKVDMLQRGQKIEGLNIADDELKDIVKYSHYFIFHTLAYEMLGRRENGAYQRFVDKVLRGVGPHCIFSFNYDLLLEDRLVHSCLLKPLSDGTWEIDEALRWCYGLVCSNTYHQVPYDANFRSGTKITYYKLHGSLNLGFCPVTKEVNMYALHADQLAYQRFFKGEWRCHSAEHDSQPLVVPPLERKDIDIPALHESWGLAEEMSREATELHILGYSLPVVDESARSLLQKVPISNLEKVIIANPNDSHVNRLIETLKLPRDRLQIYSSMESYLEENICV